jgi:hypothetical protein
MIRYRNLSGNSGVFEYELGNDFILVVFSTGARYKYSYASAGAQNVDHMKLLAAAGYGLNSFINSNRAVRYGYVR